MVGLVSVSVLLDAGASHGHIIIKGTPPHILLGTHDPRLCEQDLCVFWLQLSVQYRLKLRPDVVAKDVQIELGIGALRVGDCAWGVVGFRLQIAVSSAFNNRRETSHGSPRAIPMFCVMLWCCRLHRWRNVCGSIQRIGNWQGGPRCCGIPRSVRILINVVNFVGS